MTGSLLIQNARYLDVVSGQWCEGDIRIQDGTFVNVGGRLSPHGERLLDASGHHVLPDSSTATCI